MLSQRTLLLLIWLNKLEGGSINIHSLVPIGTDPHEHEVLPEDIQKSEESDILLYNALNLETGNG